MLNKCQFIGRLGKDPELKNLSNGQSVANFSLACGEKWKDKATGETKEKTEWVNIVAWGVTADVAGKYLHKGDLVYVEGKMSTRSWEKEGVTKYTTEITIFNLVMLGSKKQDGEKAPVKSGDAEYNKPAGGSAGDIFDTPSTPVGGKPADDIDDLPFRFKPHNPWKNQ